MKLHKYLCLVGLTLCAATAWGQTARREPHIGYIFPAGGRQGTVFEVTVGGQLLRDVSDVHISGDGVSASIVKSYRPGRNIPPEQRQELRDRLRELWEKRVAQLPAKDRAGFPMPAGLGLPGRAPESQRSKTQPAKAAQTQRAKAAQTQGANVAQTQPAGLPDHPLLRNLDGMSFRELQHVANEFFNFTNARKRQLNIQIGEMVLVKVTVDRGAVPGDREMRLVSALGMTNPLCFQIGTLPEVFEMEPNDPESFSFLPKEAPVDLPVTLNGQIMPGDVDRFRFRAKQGQRLVIETNARHLVPFMADAVPGWFQATAALYDAKGREMAYGDDYRFQPDPVLFFQVPQDGEYELEIRDSLYRGREDFVYRIAVGELPFITRMFPLGGRMGVKTVAAIKGWNLPKSELPLKTQSGDCSIQPIALYQDGLLSNEVAYAVDTLEECTESEPNDDKNGAQRIALPRIINGRIDRPGDVDVYRFEGRLGDEVVAEVTSRRLYAPLDSLVRVTDATGHVLAWNDDYTLKEGDLFKDMGPLTHHADSYLSLRLPAHGSYYAHISDAENHGGEAYGYRLRISAPKGDFELRMTPSGLSIPAGRMVPITVYALRKDGFEGEIEVTLKDAPEGFVLSGGRIGAGRDRTCMTLAAPRNPSDRPVALRLEGLARIADKTITHPVVPAEDVMQAFLYQHLVPSRECLAAVRKVQWSPPPIELAESGPIRVPEGGTAEVRVKAGVRPRFQKIELELKEPAKGISIQDVQLFPGGLTFQLKAEGEKAKAGFSDNAIVEVFMEVLPREDQEKAGKAAAQRQRVSLGLMPAIPFVVVKP